MKFSDVFPVIKLDKDNNVIIQMDKEMAFRLSRKTAIKYSRLKFEKVLELIQGLKHDEQLWVFFFGNDTCPLCEKFMVIGDEKVLCYDCPVYKSTGEHGCVSTPYDEIVNAFTVGEHIPALEKEITFLKSLE